MPKGPMFNRSGFATDSVGKYTPPPVGLNWLGSGSRVAGSAAVDCGDPSFQSTPSSHSCSVLPATLAMADNESQEVSKFNNLGDGLACHLRKNYPIIFSSGPDFRLKREHPTVWSTLGYFSEPDFEMDEKLVQILEQLKLFNAAATVSQLEVRSYHVRSLENSGLVATINLRCTTNDS